MYANTKLKGSLNFMVSLLQRVLWAKVEVDQTPVGAISQGVLVLLGIEKNDTDQSAKRMADRIIDYRLFEDEQGKMNWDVTQSHGEVLIVPQFTLAADTQKGRRPSFSSAAPPDMAQALFERCVAYATDRYPKVTTGIFQAHMQVSLCNNGPVTFLLQT